MIQVTSHEIIKALYHKKETKKEKTVSNGIACMNARSLIGRQLYAFSSCCHCLKLTMCRMALLQHIYKENDPSAVYPSASSSGRNLSCPHWSQVTKFHGVWHTYHKRLASLVFLNGYNTCNNTAPCKSYKAIFIHFQWKLQKRFLGIRYLDAFKSN